MEAEVSRFDKRRAFQEFCTGKVLVVLKTQEGRQVPLRWLESAKTAFGKGGQGVTKDE